MDRDSLRQLRTQPGYLAFVSAATLARVSDEMFSVGVVLLVLDRTGSAALAGATVAAITFPSLRQRPAARRVARPHRPAAVAHGDRPDRDRVRARRAGRARRERAELGDPARGRCRPGITYPLSFGGFTSLIPSLVPGELLPPANALETTSFNAALVTGPALAGTLSGAVGPAAPLIVEAVLALAALALILRIPGLDRTPDHTTERTLWSVAGDGLRTIVPVPRCAASPPPRRSGMAGLGLLTVAFPLFAVEHLGAERSAAGYMWAAFAVGSTLGALVAGADTAPLPTGTDRVRRLRVVRPARADLAAREALPVFLALVALAALADGPALAAQFAVRQHHVPPSLYGQVFTTAVGLKVGSLALGAAVAGAVVTELGSAEALVLAATMQLLGSLVGVSLARLPGLPARDAAAPQGSARRA